LSKWLTLFHKTSWKTTTDNKSQRYFFYSRQRVQDDWWLIIYSVLPVLTRGCDLSHSAYAI